MDAKIKKFNVVCGRCQGSGRFDRGGCFGCDGSGGKRQARKPSQNKHEITVTFENGTLNHITFFARDRKTGLEIIERMIRIKGWKGTAK